MTPRSPRAASLFLYLLLPLVAVPAAADQPVRLEAGDHIAIIGNTLADRMQHDGWLETRLQARFPDHRLVFRHLGFSGDELNLRLRSRDFGSPDHWLAFTQADVVLAFFGYNESFGGEAGLDAFKQELDQFIKHTLAQKYNRRTAPQLILFSPIAHENLDSPDLPDGQENNRRLALYTEAMADVARAKGVRLVDLFHPTLELYQQTDQPLTINGVHLNERGNRLLASRIEQALFGAAASSVADSARQERLRDAVREKNFYWFSRYRTVDGYSIYGGRADLKFTNDQTNREVMQREMEVLDVMTANRDRRIWAVAQGRDLEVDDSNTPPFVPVITNKPGPLPGGKHLFLGGEEAIGRMTVAPGMKVELFASEEMFPELISPVQMAFDTRGRLWVATWRSYPHWKPKDEMDDRLLILEDSDGDGRADVCKTFAGGLHSITGFEFYGGGVIVAMAPDLLFLKDTDGDDRADVRERILHGLDSADTHHTANSFVLGPGGALYFQEGTFHHTQVETPYGPPVRSANAGVFRYEPRTHKFDVYVAFGFANPHGHVFDRWGQDIVHDGTGAVPYHAALFSGHTEFPRKHPRPPTVYQQRTRPCPGTEILSSGHFPDEMQGNLLVGNVIGVQGILQYKLDDEGSSFSGTELEPLVLSSDPNFRPVDFEIGPDGALYFVDWQNPVIGHMQHNLRDPSRDQTHGRVYRLTYPSRLLLEPAPIAGQPLEYLVRLLEEPDDRVRYRARIELSGRDTAQVLAALEQWMATLESTDPDYEHQMLEALWLYQQHNVVSEALLRRMLASPEFRARAAATRVLCYWRDRVPASLALLKTLAADEHPRVRLEAVRAASFYRVPEAVEVPLISAELPGDEYLDFVRNETMITLEPYWKQALSEGRTVAVTSDAGMRFLLRNIATEQLLAMPRDRGVLLELLYRNGLRDEHRREALAGLARLENKSELQLLLEAIDNLDEQQQTESIVYDLVRLLTAHSPHQLSAVRGDLQRMATSAKLGVVRQIGLVALITVDGGVEPAWQLAGKSLAGLRDLVDAMPLVPDPSVRAELYPKVAPLLHGLPDQLTAEGKDAAGTVGRYVRVELPGRGTLTLAEVEIFSVGGGRNVARQGRASQKNTAHGGEAARGIDGNTSGSYGSGGQTHTKENTPRPWWEVDLGEQLPIDSIVIHNRTDGTLGQRLEGFTLKVLDASRGEVYVQENVPAPQATVAFAVGHNGPAVIRRAAMHALTFVRGREAETFEKLAEFIREGTDRDAAIRAIQRLPQRFWPAEQAAPLLDQLLAYIERTATQDRTSPPALDALQLGDALVALLPADQARQARARLGELGVRVLRIGTLPHRMAYDKERLVVRAGKPVEFLFENTDIMPHNFVITQPGALEEVGLLAEATAQDPESIRREYVPESDKILLASRLLQPRDTQKLSFLAPSRPGVYPFVCTYPGHWRRMYGALYVVQDLDEYLADPESYLAAHPLTIADELLKFNRPRKEWQFDELAASVEQLEHGRSFGNGKQIFQVANCVACHKLGGAGQQIGPDLAQLDPKLTKVDILAELLDPSKRINEKFHTYVFELASGKIVTGLILEETPETLTVIENPLAKADPLVLDKSQIDVREKSPNSIMPQGLLDKLTRDEILDLIAYVAARGQRDHMLFHHDH